jgi:hypothetical protein
MFALCCGNIRAGLPVVRILPAAHRVISVSFWSSNHMSDVVTDPSLAVAYRALERRREEVIAARDRIAAELNKLDSALEALQTLADSAPEAARADGQEAAVAAAKTAETPAKLAAAVKPASAKPSAAAKPATAKAGTAKTRAAKPPRTAKAGAAKAGTAKARAAKPPAAKGAAAPKPAAEAGRAADRKARVIEFLLENPREWLTSSEIAVLTEGENVSETQLHAVSETLRRLLRRGAVQRDGENRPVKYQAVSSVLRELLLSLQ